MITKTEVQLARDKLVTALREFGEAGGKYVAGMSDDEDIGFAISGSSIEVKGLHALLGDDIDRKLEE